MLVSWALLVEGWLTFQKSNDSNIIISAKQEFSFNSFWHSEAVFVKLGWTLSNAKHTPHFNGKKLSTNSPWDFEYVLETLDDYWVDPDENFCPESTRTRWRFNHFSKKWSKSKSDTTLSIKKPFITPNFCGWNFSAMHHFWVWIFFVSKNLRIFGMKNRKCSKTMFFKNMIKNQT